jgi:hypothetical protein
LRCVRECPQHALSALIQPEWKTTSDPYWTPEIIQSLVQQAETGKVPVSGQGYRGPFAGKDFDSMWTDMSEIVRPTRDGIHGREYISTAIFLGRKPFFLSFPPGFDPSPVLEIPIPILFDVPPEPCNTASVRQALQHAAQALGTFCIRRVEECSHPLPAAVAPLLRPADVPNRAALIRQATLLELECDGHVHSLATALDHIRHLNPNAVVAVRLECDDKLAEELARAGVGVLHLIADAHGQTKTLGHIKDALRAVHSRLLDARLRDHVTILISGDIAAAEHVPKAIICGADGVALDLALMVALECWRGSWPPWRAGDWFDSRWGAQRIINLFHAWRVQLIEILQELGMRSILELRGRVDTLWYIEELEEMERL